MPTSTVMPGPTRCWAWAFDGRRASCVDMLEGADGCRRPPPQWQGFLLVVVLGALSCGVRARQARATAGHEIVVVVVRDGDRLERRPAAHQIATSFVREQVLHSLLLTFRASDQPIAASLGSWSWPLFWHGALVIDMSRSFVE